MTRLRSILVSLAIFTAALACDGGRRESLPAPQAIHDPGLLDYEKRASCADLAIKLYELQKREAATDKRVLFNPRYNFDSRTGKCVCRVSFGGPPPNSGAIIYDVFTGAPMATWEQAKGADVAMPWPKFHELEKSLGVAWSND